MARAALLLVATAACSDSPSLPPDHSAHDVSAAVAQTVAVAFGTYFPGTDAVALPAACPYAADAGAFVCAPAAAGQFTYTLTYQLVDADGRSLGAPSDRVATMRVVIDQRGERRAASGADSVTTAGTAHIEMLVTGLRAGTLAIAGTTTSHYDVSSRGGSVPHSVRDAVGTMTGVRFDDGAPWPRAGTITSSEVTSVVTSGAPPSASRSHSALEFDGTSVVTITTSGDAFTLRCRYDLSGRTATACS